MSFVKVIHADSRDALKIIRDCSIDSVVTDPPYALVSIVKRFGGANAAPAKDRDGVYKRAARGFMGKQWDTGEAAFAVEFWAEVMRVLKPGGYVLAFSGTRTYHRLACAIEDAGFEIRDQIGWLYGSGFPKSHDVSKAIDKAAGAEREVVGRAKGAGTKDPNSFGNGHNHEYDITATATDDARQWQGWGTALKPAWEPIVMARKPLIGTVAENVLQHGTGAINVDGCRVGNEVVGWGGARGGSDDATQSQGRNYRLGEGEARPVEGRWPANIIHDGSDEVLAAFPDAPGQQAAVRPDSGGGQKTNGIYGSYTTNSEASPRGDSGSAARFFYSAKADATDRLGSKHPTVKPTDLMAYLCRLVTPPGGTVLDPFAGSGSTGMSCLREGFNAILIEREDEYVADIRRRIAHVSGTDTPLFSER